LEAKALTAFDLFLTFARLFAQQLASIHCLRALPSGLAVSASDDKIIFFYANSLNVAFLRGRYPHSSRGSFARRTFDRKAWQVDSLLACSPFPASLYCSSSASSLAAEAASAE
jgi:hypothetical protein